MPLTTFEPFGRVFDPWQELRRMEREMNRLLSRAPAAVEFPAVNIWTEEERAIVTTEVPGVSPQDMDISVVGSTLTIRGSREPEALKEGESYHRRERWYGQFSRSVDLPFAVEAGAVEARFDKGVLYITLPRAEAEKPRKISVKAE